MVGEERGGTHNEGGPFGVKLESNAEAENNTGKHDTVPEEKRERVSLRS